MAGFDPGDVLESPPSWFIHLDPDFRIVQCSPLPEGLPGTPETLVGRVLWEAWPSFLGTRLEQQVRWAMERPGPWAFETTGPITGRWYAAWTCRTDQGLNCFIRDVSGACDSAAEVVRLRSEMAFHQVQVGTIMNLLPVGVILVDAPTRKIVFANREARRLLGPRLQVPVSIEAVSFVAPVRADGTTLPFDEFPVVRALRGEESVPVTTARVEGGERPMIVSVAAAPIRDDLGNVAAAAVTLRDVTEKEEARRALEQSEERLRLALRATRGATFDVDLVRHEVFWSPEILEWYGVPPGATLEVDEHLIPKGFHPEDRARMIAAVRQAENPEAPEVIVVRHRIVRPDGSIRWLLLHGQALFGRVGDTVRAVRSIGTVHDITDQMAAEDRLRRSEERLRLATEAALIGMWFWDLRTDELSFNDVFFQAMGYAKDQPPTVRELVASVLPDHREAVRQVVESVRTVPGAHHIEFPVQSGRWVRIQGTTCCDDSGRPDRAFGVALDISAGKRVEAELERRVAERTALVEWQARQLRELTVELTRTEQRERQRLAGMLHDQLQQVLVAARIQTAMAASDAVDPSSRAAAQTADGLLLRAIEASRSLALELVPAQLREQGLHVALRWLARWMGEAHCLTVDLALRRGTDLRGHPALQLFEAARELLLNVVKHSGVRRARLEVSRLATHLRMVVEDGGRGFPGGRPPGEGAGLGLASLRLQARSVGGALEFEEAPGGGVRVVVSVPAGRRKARA